MDITLPKRIGGTEAITLENAHQITVIGANGSGKTRFCRKLLQMCGDKAYKLSALKAIFAENEKNELKGSIDMLFEEATSTGHILKSAATSEFDRLMFLLLHDEFIDLIEYKADIILKDDKSASVPKTKLDDVVKKWQEVFPKNKILRDGGKLIFTSIDTDQTYSSFRLSDGEKTVLYYIGAVLYAMPEAVILVDDPETFLHHSIMQALWNAVEEMRPDCTFIYNTHDIEFAASRIDNKCVWVKNFDGEQMAWDYDLVNPGESFSDELYFDLLGSRKPILFVEGDELHSIDSKLYPLIFTDYTVKPLGSCNKVIEATRSFNELKDFHHLDSHGIVDRDRRTDEEVQYLRDKKIFVPNVAEIENILMLEGVIRTVARHYRKDENRVFMKVKGAVLNMFRSALRQQALEHVRHRVKRNVEMRIDKRFQNINALEEHMTDLVREINPHGMYEELCRRFHEYERSNDYAGVLKVFNEKSMLPDSNVAQLCGMNSKEGYIRAVLNILKEDGRDAVSIRKAIMTAFGIREEEALIDPETKEKEEK
jgi:ABC-type cobalamin/Fe3+-siderophores transport system ATPase subunit